MADQQDYNGAYSEVFEEGMDLQQAQTIHRIRANSTIMQLKKILGESNLLVDLRRAGLGCRNLMLIESFKVANRGEIRMYPNTQD